MRGPTDGPPLPPIDKTLVKFYGVQACRAIFARRPNAIRRVFVAHKLAQQMEDLVSWCGRASVPLKLSDPQELSRVAATEHHEGICIEAKPLTPMTPGNLANFLEERVQFVVVLLERVENPHNVGAILRTCGFFGIDAVIVQSRELKTLSGALCRIAEGAAENVPVTFVERFDRIEPVLKKLKAEIVASTPHEAESVYDVSWKPRTVIAFGAEGSGLSDKVLERAGLRVKVPGSGTMESLNVASAVSAILSDYSRRAASGLVKPPSTTVAPKPAPSRVKPKSGARPQSSGRHGTRGPAKGSRRR